MLLDWFNARAATEVGTTLADCYLPAGDNSAPGARQAESRRPSRVDLQKFLQRVAREGGSLKLNLFKRAKLLNAFKWRLLERGVERSTVDQLTELVLLQLSGRSLGSNMAATGVRTRSRPARRRVRTLLLEADARFADRQYAKAAERLQEVLAIEPRHAIAHANLGSSLSNLGRYREAEQEFRRAIGIRATCSGAHLGLGILLRAKGELAASETALRRAVNQDPRDPQALVDLGLTLSLLSKLSDARECFEKALRLKPWHAGALCGLGRLARVGGRFEDAEKLYRSALETEPLNAAAWAAIPELRRMSPADSEWLEGVARTLESGVQPLEESKLRFAMGKYFDDIGKFSRAFEQFKRANELYKPVAVPYDRAARTQVVDNMVRVYTRERLSSSVTRGSESDQPVFVVGMMRSGTTLVEQIIASHPSAVGAGELDFWNIAALKSRAGWQHEPPDPALTRKLADGYLKLLRQHSAEALRVVDKATSNSDLLGLIHCVFPRARIIYVRRDPVDTCLSCYFQDFANVASFTLDMTDLAHYYHEHHRLMDHWRSTLPAGTLLEVPYAELVADQEGWSRKMIEFVGLEWDPRCLDFQKTERPVLTASSWQVRQRVYASSVGRWKNYQKFIGPLLKLRDLAP
jgi:tetratricopeptide (TPR) repeat protein